MADFDHNPTYIRARHNRTRRDRQGSAGNTSREAKAAFAPVPESNHLGYLSTRYYRFHSSPYRAHTYRVEPPSSALTLNRIVGSGIFVASPVIVSITESKGLSLVLWLVGGVITWAGCVNSRQQARASSQATNDKPFSLSVYLEYGIQWPLTGGEFVYVSTKSLAEPETPTFATDQLRMDATPKALRIHVLYHVRCTEWQPCKCFGVWFIHHQSQQPTRRPH
jgi:hypothetical protein